MAFLIDCSDDNYLDAYEKLCEELSSFSKPILNKPRIILCNKIDVAGAAERAAELAEKYKDVICLPMSVHSKDGLDKVKKALIELVQDGLLKDTENNVEKITLKSEFLQSRSVYSDEDEEVVQYPGSE